METVTITRLGHLGDGIAPGPVFVPRALPNETVRGRVMGDRMPIPEIVTPSPERVTPPCPHYDRCGACALMHASDTFVARFKVRVVAQALTAQGLAAPITGIATSPPASRRRAVLSARRSRDGVEIGFHERASDRIVPVPHCRVLVPQIVKALPVLSDLVAAGAGRKDTLSLAVTHGPAGLDVVVSGGKEPDRALSEELARIAGAADLARLTWGDIPIAQARPPHQMFGDVACVPPPGAFLQATKSGEAALWRAVRDIVGDAKRVADLFAGCGTFALPLSRQAEVVAVEGLRSLSDATRAAWQKAGGLHALEAETRDLFQRPLLASELGRLDAVLIDPPRAGAEAQFAELAQSDVPVIAAVSCNPVTFARDVAIAQRGGYRLKSVKVVDQFRWSPHVELVAHLSR